MVVEEEKRQSAFLKELERSFTECSEDALAKWRRLGWNQLQSVGLPTLKQEDYRYLRLRKMWAKKWDKPAFRDLGKAEVEAHLLPECEGRCIVFVNGVFSEDLSSLEENGDLSLIKLSDATKKYRGFLQGRLKRSAQEERDPFVLANQAAHREGAFLYLQPGRVVERPIQLLHLIDCEEGAQLFPRFQVFAGAQSELSLIRSTHLLNESAPFVSSLLDLAIEEGAKVALYGRESQSRGHHFDALRATQKRDSRLSSALLTEGAEISRRDYHVTLTGENAECDLAGLALLHGKSEAHTYVTVDHQAPHCRSWQLFKGVFDDFSRSSFEGKIMVRQAAQKTDAYQLNKNLLLSENAHADSKPNLEIFADDVKASHGSTVGQLDPDQLHYLRTRGCSKQQAKRLLIRGFAREALEKFTLPEERERVEEIVKQGIV